MRNNAGLWQNKYPTWKNKAYNLRPRIDLVADNEHGKDFNIATPMKEDAENCEDQTQEGEAMYSRKQDGKNSLTEKRDPLDWLKQCPLGQTPLKEGCDVTELRN